MNEFFFMDSDEEQETYGAAAKVPLALAANSLKSSKQEAASKVKQIADFKVRVLDFIAIYVKEMKKANPAQRRSYDALKLIKQLLKALQVAHSDKNTILFERIKTVLTLIARGNSSSEGEAPEESKGTTNEIKLNKEEIAA